MNRNKRPPSWITKDIENLFEAFLKVRDKEECSKFLRDLMTVQEIKTIAKRWKVAKMLEEGETYKDIEKATGMSSTTIARINRWKEYGEGGYKLILGRVKKK